MSGVTVAASDLALIYLSHVDVVLEFPRMETVVGENGRAVAVPRWIGRIYFNFV